MPNNNNVVDTLQIDVVLNSDDYKKRAKELEDMNDDLEKSLVGLDKEHTELQKTHDKTTSTLNNVIKGFGRFFAAIAVTTGIEKLVNEVASANDQLGFLEKQLNTSAGTIRNWQGAISAGGGSAQGATNAFKSLTTGINNFVIKGEAGLTPYLNALGVNMFDAQGHIKKTDELMLDLADSFSKMDSSQAYTIGKDMGFDEGTIGSLIQGRDALKESLAYQDKLYKSSQQDIKNSRELQKNRSLLNSQWESFKTMLGNQFIPIMIKVSQVVLRLFETMQKHQGTVKAVFGGLAVLLSASIIPLFTRALTPLLAFMGPFAPFIAVVAALSVGFLALYDDYKTWAEGGKSLFDWGALKTFMDENTFSAKNLGDSFKEMGKQLKEQAIPTLIEYKNILKDLLSGDFAKAGDKAKKMVSQFSDNATKVIATATGQKAEDIQGFLGESAYKLTHYGKNFDEYNAPKGNDFNSTLRRQAIAGGITDKKELDSFVANVGHETGDGKRLSENTNYSYGSWKKLAPRQTNVRNWLKSNSEDDFKKLTAQQKLNIMYNGMNGNRAGTDDGYNFRGRGAIQITGRGEYERVAKQLNRPDIMTNPDLLATDKDLAAQSAVLYWKNKKGVGESARSGDVARTRQLVNGSDVGLDDVRSRYNALQKSMNSSVGAGQTTNNSGGNVTNNVTVSMPNLNVTTSANTLLGVSADAIKQNSSQLTGLIGVMK